MARPLPTTGRTAAGDQPEPDDQQEDCTVTLTDPDAPTERTVVRYLNRAGALVTITKKPGEPGAETCYGADCAGCLDAMFGTRAALSPARDWASKHAEQCRALPPLGEQDARPE